MKIKWKEVIISLIIPLAVGGVSGFLNRDSMKSFESLNQPPLSPPGWLFPVVWTILYTLMGIASYLIYTSYAPKGKKKNALTAYGVQLFFNFVWSFLFFNFGLYTFSFIWILILLALIILTAVLFSKISKPAAYLMIPYILWVSFAAYLNLGVAILN